MSEKLVEEKVIATFRFKKRGKPRYYYQSEILCYYTPYLVYYRLVPREENLEKLPHLLDSKDKKNEKNEELLMFPVRGIDAVVNYAKSLDAEITYRRRYLPRLKKSVEVPTTIFLDRYSAMRHAIFSLTYATVRSVEKVEKIREVMNSLNINIIEPFYNTAILRYEELRGRADSGWYWKILRIGRAFKVMYMIDR